jgi:NADPH2:quinone reductase
VKAWRTLRYGKPSEVMALEDVPLPDPGPGEVRIRVTSATLNFNDLDIIRGRYKSVSPPPPFTPGMEVLGVVDACGEGTDRWLGRRVVALPKGIVGGYAEAVLATTNMMFDMPAEIAEPEAAAIFMPFHLAWFGLHNRGGLKAGETLLVHAGAGGVGSAAVQLGVQAGARVIATAGSAEKVALCKELGADVAINYRDDDFAAAVLKATDGRGVDVAFDAVGGAVTSATFGCMAFNGRHLLVGFASGTEALDEGSIVPRPVIYGNFSLSGVCLAYTDDPAPIKAMIGYNFVPYATGEVIHARLLELLKRGEIRPLVGSEVQFADLPEALDAMERRETTGRVVVRLA